MSKEIENLLSDLESKSVKYIFRGVSKIKFNMEPSLYRKNDYGEYHFFLKLIKEKLNKIIDCNDIETIEYMQHFGAKTNMLDFSYDYKVSLYFACSKDFDEDGKIYILNVNNYNKFLKEEKTLTYNMIMNDKIIYDVYFDQFDNGVISRLSDYNDEEIWIGIDYPLIVEPTILFDRIRQQKGLFLFWGSNFTSLNEQLKEYNYKYKIYDEIIIKKEYKKQILKELNDKYHINETSLYVNTKDIENVMKEYSSEEDDSELIKKYHN